MLGSSRSQRGEDPVLGQHPLLRAAGLDRVALGLPHLKPRHCHKGNLGKENRMVYPKLPLALDGIVQGEGG